ncbi:MAG: hypothetical protein ACRDS1_07555 [Pseudonocardiaceae bacterium]
MASTTRRRWPPPNSGWPQTADAVLVRDELDAVPAVVALSRRARRLVMQNLTLAVAGHEGSTVLVALNGLRLLRRCAWR